MSGNQGGYSSQPMGGGYGGGYGGGSFGQPQGFGGGQRMGYQGGSYQGQYQPQSSNPYSGGYGGNYGGGFGGFGGFNGFGGGFGGYQGGNPTGTDPTAGGSPFQGFPSGFAQQNNWQPGGFSRFRQTPPQVNADPGVMYQGFPTNGGAPPMPVNQDVQSPLDYATQDAKGFGKQNYSLG